MDYKLISLIFIMLSASFVLGWGVNEVYDDYQKNKEIENYTRQYNGLQLSGYGNKTDALDKAKEYDERGDWVCINVREMNFERGYKTCVHECTHVAYSEIFAEKCEADPDYCLNYFEVKK